MGAGRWIQLEFFFLSFDVFFFFFALMVFRGWLIARAPGELLAHGFRQQLFFLFWKICFSTDFYFCKIIICKYNFYAPLFTQFIITFVIPTTFAHNFFLTT